MRHFRIRLATNAFEGLRVWLASLNEARIQELGSLDYNSGTWNKPHLELITKDWIEEHGGERGWWTHILTSIEEVK